MVEGGPFQSGGSVQPGSGRAARRKLRGRRKGQLSEQPRGVQTQAEPGPCRPPSIIPGHAPHCHLHPLTAPTLQAEDAVKFCSEVMSIDPANKKARLRRGLALEKLGLDAVAAADMVLLLAEDKAIPQVQERSRGGRLHPAPTSRHTTSPRKWTKS